MMAAKCIFLTSVFALLEAGPTVYWHLRNSESVGAGPHVEVFPKKLINSKMRLQVHRGRRQMVAQTAHQVDSRIATLKIASCVPAGAR